MKAFHLQTEPWLFTINRHGGIAARLEGAFGATAFTARCRRPCDERARATLGLALAACGVAAGRLRLGAAPAAP